MRIRAKPLGPCSGQPVASRLPGRQRRLLAVHDLARVVVVAEPPAPGSSGMGRRAPGWSWGGALRRVGAAGQKGATSWDARLFRILNQVPPAAASVLTPLSHLFLQAGIIAVVLLTVVFVVPTNRSVLPVAAAAVAAGAAWVLAHVAKAIADRPRPYEVMADAVLRQQPAHGTSFPSSHTAVTLAVVIALVPFLVRPLAAASIGYWHARRSA